MQRVKLCGDLQSFLFSFGGKEKYEEKSSKVWFLFFFYSVYVKLVSLYKNFTMQNKPLSYMKTNARNIVTGAGTGDSG